MDYPWFLNTDLRVVFTHIDERVKTVNKMTGFMIFVAGAAIGSAATWYYAKKKYEQIAQEEIDSVKAVFSHKQSDEDLREDAETEQDDVRLAAEKAKEKPSVAEYAKKLSKEGYTNYSNSETLTDEQPKFKPPYVIPPEEFGERDDYDKISLSYYADHILTDDNDEILEDVEGAIGFESLNHFGEYEDDSVFVRNERLKVDYEILLDQRKYSDVIKSKPYLMED